VKTKSVNRKRKRCRGQEAVEWWVIVAGVAVIVMFALLKWGQTTNTMMNDLTDTLNSVNKNIQTST
jgi:type VI protein secretion system component VasF